MKDIRRWYIVSYINDIETTAGGVRPARLNHYLNEKGFTSTMVTRSAVNSNEVSISEPLYAKIPAISKILSPDHGIFWADKVAGFLQDKNDFVLLTTSPLHSIHRVGLYLKKKKKNILWIADFRDPFTLNPFYNPFFYKKILDTSYEKKILKSADVLIFNTDVHEVEYKKHYPWLNEKECVVVRNGYDINSSTQKTEREHKIIYSGGIYKGLAIKGVGNFLRETSALGFNIQCDFIGEHYPEFINYTDVLNYNGKFNSADVPEIISRYKYGLVYLPAKFKNSGRVPTKLYDYIGAGLIPVCINPSIEITNMIIELGYGICIDESEGSSYKKFIDFFKSMTAQYIKPDQLVKYSRNSQFDILLDFIKNNFGNQGGE